MDFYEFGARIALIYIPLLFSLCFHEYAHGLVAKWKGDLTADRMGRLNMNPMSHADPIGTFLLPLSMLYVGGPIIGWGKPVPVDERNLKSPRVDMFWVAFAGPLSNILLAVVGAILVAVFGVFVTGSQYSESFQTFFVAFIRINLLLAIFNLIPVHPLDGGKVLARFLPEHINEKLESYQHISGIILMVLMLSGLLSFLFYPISGVTQFLISLFYSIFQVLA
jgi:Zn-dependent protease